MGIKQLGEALDYLQMLLNEMSVRRLRAPYVRYCLRFATGEIQ